MGYRFVGVLNDPNSAAGGSNYDALANPGPIPHTAPSTFFPVVSGNVDPGFEDRGRGDEVRGRRASIAPYPYRGAPMVNFRCRLYPALAKWALPRVLGKTVAPTGVAPASITSKFSPIERGGRLPAINVVMVRETQIDYCYGVWVESVELDFPTESDAFITVSGRALYHETVDLAATTFTPDTAAFVDPYAAVTLKASEGPIGSLVDIDCISSVNFTFNNSLSDDDDVRFCKGKNVVKELVDDSYRFRHYPDRHKIGSQEITGSLGFGDVQPSIEERRLITTADALRVELTGNPAGTTPPADELIRFDFHSHVITGGGADELVEEGELKSSYEFSAHLDPTTNKDFEATFIDDAAVTLPA